jgi:hypothetical protein
MTKDWRPRGAETSADDNRRLEASAIAEIDRLPTQAWADMVGLWLQLPSAWLSTQKRLLMHMIEEAAKRGDPLSPEFVKRFARHLARILAIPKTARGSIHDVEAFRTAAQYLAWNPDASLDELASAAGLKSKQARHVIRPWKQTAEFKRWVREFELRPRRGGGRSPAYDALMTVVVELRKAYPKLTEAQVFAAIYTHPAARKLVKRERDFEKARLKKTRPARRVGSVCQKKF